MPAYDLSLHEERMRLVLAQIGKDRRRIIVSWIGRMYGADAEKAIKDELKTIAKARAA